VSPRTGPIGVVLAGGGGRRIGGNKATVMLAGRPLISYPLAALSTVVGELAVVAKAGTRLPLLPDGVEVWVEPDTPQHPVVGLVEALTRAGGRSVLVTACDTPLLGSQILAELASADARGAPAVVAAASGGGLEPLLGRYEPAALMTLRLAVADRTDKPLRQLVAALSPRRIDVPAGTLFNVNSPADLAHAERELAGVRDVDV
jgi:molybdopterin-guanine dinucleotide biosynthesis protein A